MNLWVFVTEAVASDEEVQKHREAHLRRQVELEKAGILFAAGPLVHPDGTYARAGMVVIRADSAEEAKKIADADPMHVHGVRKYRPAPMAYQCQRRRLRPEQPDCVSGA